MNRRRWLGDVSTVLICIGIFTAIVILSLIERAVRATKRRIFDEPLQEWEAAMLVCSIAIVTMMLAT